MPEPPGSSSRKRKSTTQPSSVFLSGVASRGSTRLKISGRSSQRSGPFPACIAASCLHLQVSQVGTGLFLSSLDAALNRGVLEARNVTLVVNASGLMDVSYPPVRGLQVLQVPIQDRPDAPLRDYFDSVSERIQQNQTGTTLVHCTAGRSRSPTLIMAHLMRSEGLSLRRAHELVLEQRPFIRPNAGFWRQLMDYEAVLLGRNTVRMTRTSAGVLPEALPDPENPNSVTAYCINV